MKLLSRVIRISACLLLLWSGMARGAEENVTLNFVNADIDSVVKAVGLISGRNFVIDPRVKGTVNIVSAKPVARDMTYPILLSALRLQGYAAVESNGVTKIVPEADAKQNFSVTGGKGMQASGDKIVTQVYPLQHESASQLVAVLRPLITPNNSIAAYANTNTLVITDYADNVRRINRIIESIDQPNHGEVTVIKLAHVSALDLAQTLTRLLSDTPQAAAGAQQGAAPADSGQRFVVLPDARSNSLLLRSDNPARIARARALVAQLDVPGAGSGGNIHVIYLRNAEAVRLAETLRAIVAGDAKAAASATPATPASPAAGAPPAPATGVAQATNPASIIQADPQTNSLIITAPDHVYNTLRAVIDKLDARRAQVFVEALIVEILSDKVGEFGIQWMSQLGSGSANTAVVAGTNFGTGGNNIINLNAGTALPTPGLNLGVLQRITLGGKEVIGLTALARALEKDANANVLSTPNLLTLDNEEAKIIVGQNVPFITGSYAQAAGVGATVNPFQTMDRKDVGLTLKVKPQVAEGGAVKMQIYQEASSVDDLSNPAGIIINKRAIESSVLVDDGQIIVLGGLIKDDVRGGQDKVPALGDIPVLGSLFKYDTRHQVKTNLMVFLRPQVLRNANSASQLTGDRYDYIRNEQSRSGLDQQLFLPATPPPLLPERGVPEPAQ